MKKVHRLFDQLGTLLLPLLKKGFWAVGDQGLFAGANFLLNILLARWLSPEAYGAFAIAYSIFIFVGIMNASFLIQPMLVFGSERFSERFPAYLRLLLLRGTGGFAAAGALLLAAGGGWFAYTGSADLALALFGLAMTLPFLLFVRVVRRALYVHDQHHWAAVGGGVYLVSVAALVYGFYWYATVSVWSAMLILGGASMVAGGFMSSYLDGWTTARADSSLADEVLQRHWDFGSWAAGTGAVNWMMGNIYILVLPLWGSLEASGAFKALMNLVKPVLHTYSAFSMLLIPEFVEALSKGRFWQKALLVSACLLGGSGAYWLLIGLFGPEIMGLLYGGQYSTYAPLLWVLGAYPFLDSARVVLEAGLRAIERPDWLFWAYVGGATITLTAGLGLLLQHGILGATLGLAVSSVVMSAGSLYFLAVHSNQAVNLLRPKKRPQE